jgi:hypothetical protein
MCSMLRSAGQADWLRLYLLLTALEAAVEDADSDPAAALQGLHAEQARVLPSPASGSADELLRRELRYARRLADALFGGTELDDRVLTRPVRSCATLGCGNDALGRYCLSCDARRASMR